MGQAGRVPAVTADNPAVVAAPAKLTLSLRIVGVRPDGYHLIDAEMVTLDLADTLEFSAGDSLEWSPRTQRRAAWSCRPATTTWSAGPSAAVGRRAAVRLVKRIPAGGGLGGGSADAAAVLRWAGCSDLAVAAALGADVPFLPGRRPGPGDRDRRDDHAAALRARRRAVLHPAHAAVRRFHRRRLPAMGRPGRPPVRQGVNDLEAAAVAVAPELAEWRDRLGEATGQQPALAGSGSTWFVAGAYPGPGRVVVRIARPADR